MGFGRHVTPTVALLFFLLVAREIYPYTEPLNAQAAEGYGIEKGAFADFNLLQAKDSIEAIRLLSLIHI